MYTHTTSRHIITTFMKTRSMENKIHYVQRNKIRVTEPSHSTYWKPEKMENILR